MAQSAALSNRAAGPWLFRPSIDLLIGCGAWSLPLLALTYFLNDHAAVQVSFAFYFLGVFCNQPHYMATVYRAYRTPADFNRYRFFTVYVTVFIGLTALVVHLAPALFPWLLTLYLTWSPWHYTGQNFGIALTLARRAGAQPSPTDRNLIWWSYFASYAIWFLALHHAGTAERATLHILPIPEEIAWAAKLGFLAVYIVAGGVGHARWVRQAGLRAMTGPLVLFATQFLWFLLPEILRETTILELPPTYSSAGILAFMHCAQYLWITSYYAQRERAAAGVPAAPTVAVPFRFGRYYLVLVLGGIALFVPGPWLASRFGGHDLVESFFIFAALINLHHFILDGAIWKLRDGRIARLLLGRNPPAVDTADDLSRAPNAWSWLFGPSVRARTLRYGCAALLVAFALLDQSQFWLTLKNSGQPAIALAQLFNPQDTRVYYQRARQLATAGDTDGAIRELHRALAVNPRQIPAQHLLGELLSRSERTSEALAHYEAMAVQFPPDLIVLTNAGLLSVKAGKFARAREHFETALQLSPTTGELHLYLGQALESAGDLPAATEEYARFIALHRDDHLHADVLPNYLNAGLRLADLSWRQNHPEQALTLLRRVSALAHQAGRSAEAALADERLVSYAPPR